MIAWLPQPDDKPDTIKKVILSYLVESCPQLKVDKFDQVSWNGSVIAHIKLEEFILTMMYGPDYQYKVVIDLSMPDAIELFDRAITSLNDFQAGYTNSKGFINGTSS